jgi:GTP pyrophosphokinase
VEIKLIAADRKGLLRDVSSVLADEDANVLGTNTHSDPTNDVATMHFTIEVGTVDQLDRVLIKLNQLPDVHDVRRSQ